MPSATTTLTSPGIQSGHQPGQEGDTTGAGFHHGSRPADLACVIHELSEKLEELLAIEEDTVRERHGFESQKLNDFLERRHADARWERGFGAAVVAIGDVLRIRRDGGKRIVRLAPAT